LTQLQGQYSAVFARQQDLLEKQDQLSSVATIVQPALPPTAPAGPSRLRYLTAGLVAGLCLAVLAALLVERFDDHIFNAETLAMATSSPITLVAPRTGRRRPDAHRPYSLALASVLTRFPDARTVLVTAASRRDHSDAVAAGLGAVAAQAGERVLVVQGDGQAPDHRLPAAEVAGMTTVAVPSETGAGIAAVVTDMRRELASPDTIVLIAVPSPDTNPSALMLGRTAKRAVIVATAGVTRFPDARRTAELLRYSGVDVVAAILQTRRSPMGAR
jgi:Mrp family chromosome partitioning ATPase